MDWREKSMWRSGTRFRGEVVLVAESEREKLSRSALWRSSSPQRASSPGTPNTPVYHPCERSSRGWRFFGRAVRASRAASGGFQAVAEGHGFELYADGVVDGNDGARLEGE